jgi:hypothetical protein
MRAAPPHLRPRVPRLLLRMWRGERQASEAFALLVGGLVALGAAPLLTTASLAIESTASSRAAFNISMLTLIVFLLLGGVRALILGSLQLGILRLLIALPIAYILSIGVAGFLIPGDRQNLTHWETTRRVVSEQGRGGVERVMNLSQELATEGLRFVTGRGRNIVSDEAEQVPVLEAMPGTNTTATAEASPNGGAVAGSSRIQLGVTVEVVRTGGVPLRARREPSTSSGIVARFAPGTALVVLDGPVEADGYTWWRVQGAGKEGWCASQYLEPAQ